MECMFAQYSTLGSTVQYALLTWHVAGQLIGKRERAMLATLAYAASGSARSSGCGRACSRANRRVA